ncbi:ATP-binding protein [Streptomyces anulatus]|uniref:wHTH domain-containing protein n=1 Tax=Streptomyces anulatus TaxID=1892 RepID=UPI002DDA9227|nr:ATP-binding protein [Streptomyces anulatus]WSC60505.1 ATP-binding protein [Streptomyces anulatus]
MSPDEVTNIINGGVYKEAVIQAATVTVQSPPAPAPPSDPWVRAVLESGVWTHAAPRGVEAHVRHATRLAQRLADVRDAAEQRISGDAWADPGFATRFADRVEWLLGEPDGALDLYPAEAGVLVLLPYLYQVHRLLLVSSHLEVDPTDLRARPRAAGERARYQSFLAGQHLLVSRAELRPEAAGVIGWWLYHRWLAKEEKGADQLAALEAEIAGEGGPLTEALNPRFLARILIGLRLGPDVCNPEHLGRMEADQLLPGPGRQRFRERRASLLATVAYSAAAELTVLPDTVVQHTGVPGAVDLDGVRRTLDRMAWGGSPELPVLKAVCEHEAVVEALREHAERLDGLLLAVGRTLPDRIAQPMPPLPTRVSADGVEPAEGTFTSGARFRLDDRRVRDLLTGTQLYKDRGLAVRELYQNALDACRYRRARTQFLERSGRPFHPYEGRIDFVQGTDDDGRAYLECADDGVGMGEAELRGVFSDAGSRFAEQPDFLLEQAEWERVEPPVRLHPNSRFGIGVLSYFMLADEIRVTSCRMGLDGVPGPLVEAHIFGPNHMFRIVEKTERGTVPGTRVRLYLREPRRSWSALETLAEVLCIAEFRTAVTHGGRQRVWEAGVLRAKRGRTHGELVEWHDGPPGAQVIWCRHGGMLLVDGLVIEPRHEVGVMSGLLGVVVNLSGDHAPRQLSTDRLTVLTDIAAQVEEVLTGAAPALVASGAAFLTLAWLEDVAKSSPRIADLVAEAARAAGYAFTGSEGTPVPVEAGCFPLDRMLLPHLLASNRHAPRPASAGFSSIPDHILLWRMLALGKSDLSRELTKLVPELSEPRRVADARPSDLELLTGNRGGFGATRPSDAFGVARRLGCDPVGPAERRRLFGVADLVVPEPSGSDVWDLSDMTWLDGPYERRRTHATIGELLEIREKLGVSAARAARLLRSFNVAVVPAELPEGSPDEVDLRLLHRNGEVAEHLGIWHLGPVPPGHVAQAGLNTGLSPHAVRERLERYGLTVEPFDFPEELDEEYVSRLSRDRNGRWPWVSSTAPLTPWQLVAAQDASELTAEEVRADYERLGFTLPPRADRPESPDDFDLLAGFWEVDWSPFRTDRAPSFHQLMEVAEDLGLSLRTLTTRLAAYRVRTGMTLPQRETELDRDLFRYDSLLRITGETDERDLPWWFSLTPDDEIPFFLLVLAARDLGRRPKELASRLRTYGLRVSRGDLPPDLGQRDALRLLTADEQAVPRPAEPTMPLAQLVRIARRVDLPVVDTARHLRDLGVHVDDVATTVRAALARVPSGAGEPPS